MKINNTANTALRASEKDAALLMLAASSFPSLERPDSPQRGHRENSLFLFRESVLERSVGPDELTSRLVQRRQIFTLVAKLASERAHQTPIEDRPRHVGRFGTFSSLFFKRALPTPPTPTHSGIRTMSSRARQNRFWKEHYKGKTSER